MIFGFNILSCKSVKFQYYHENSMNLGIVKCTGTCFNVAFFSCCYKTCYLQLCLCSCFFDTGHCLISFILGKAWGRPSLFRSVEHQNRVAGQAGPLDKPSSPSSPSRLLSAQCSPCHALRGFLPSSVCSKCRGFYTMIIM